MRGLEQAAFVAAISPGDRVTLAIFGDGQVLEVVPSGQDQIVTVTFKTAGRRRLMAGVAGLERI